VRERESVCESILIQHLLDLRVIPFCPAADGLQAWAPTSIIKILGRQPWVDSSGHTSALSPTGDVILCVMLYSFNT
jgi:hypothetical protein